MDANQVSKMKKAGKGKGLSYEELSILCEQIALILRSGLPLHDGIEAMCSDYKETRYAEGFEVLNQGVLESGSLYHALEKAGIFPDYMVEMAGIGEKTGELQRVMEQLSAYYDREAKIRRAIQNAVTYPLILIVMMAVLITVLIVQVLPIFDDVMRSMGIENAGGSLMSVGIGVGKVVLWATGIFIVIALVLVVLLKSKAGTAIKNFFFRTVRPLRKLNAKLYASRFAANMSMMLNSGFPLDESLELIAGIINDPVVSQKVNDCRTLMEEGTSFPDAVERIGLFERLHCRMIKVGFQAGQTDRVMAKLADIYEEEMDEGISRVVAIIEPSLVALMSIIIGAILLSVMLPLLSVMGGFA